MAINPALNSLVSKARAKYSNQNSSTTKMKEGRNVLRVIAPKPGEVPWVGADGQFWADRSLHWIKADENGKPLVVLGDCEHVHQTPSVINTAIQVAIDNASDETSKKLYESWRPRKSVLINAINRDDGSVGVFELTTTTFDKYLEILQAYNDAGDDISDSQTGKDVVITRTGKGLSTEYTVMIAPGVSKPVTKAQLDACVDLKKFVENSDFKGDDAKALNAIQQIAGVVVPQLGRSGVVTPTAALASPAASVADAKMTTVEMTVAPAAPAGPTPEDLAKEERRQQLLAAQRAAEAELAAMNNPEPQPAAAPEVVLGDDEQDALLAELDGLISD